MNVTIELDNREAWALAQFCKRSCWGTFAECATGKAETQTMIDAIEKTRAALAEAGYSPR